MAKPARRGLAIESRVITFINNDEGVGEGILRHIAGVIGVGIKCDAARTGSEEKKADIKLLCEDVLFNNYDFYISVKSYDPRFNYNHVERGYVDDYRGRWGLPSDVYRVLKLFVGEVDENGNPLPVSDFLDSVGGLSMNDIEREIKDRVGRGLLSENEASELLEEFKYKRITPGLVGKMRRMRLDLMLRLDDYKQAVQNTIDYFKAHKNEIVRDVLVNGLPIDRTLFLIVRIRVVRVVTTLQTPPV